MRASLRPIVLTCALAVLGGVTGVLGLHGDASDASSGLRLAAVASLLVFGYVSPLVTGVVYVAWAAPPRSSVVRVVLPVLAGFTGFAVGLRFTGFNFWWFLVLLQPVLALLSGTVTRLALQRNARVSSR